MQPPLPSGTILQNRYQLLSILGQGGFGRTYLATDQGRFNERCAIKELIPAQDDAYMIQKSKELFQREAAVLYQIQHPQIPQFRANFEYDQRLFLVQDYVDGKTYRALLDERKATQSPGAGGFSEGEIVQLLYQILPVLAHIHSKGIIHRDISPSNLILRTQDRLPVLIDFGVVKEIASRVQSELGAQSTSVGKLGYAPIEQMQTGQAYPNSDLYSLAVTAIVLLTGREPQQLFDDRTMAWYWQQVVPVNPQLAQVLNRMLSYRPGDRYQSAPEVMQALQTQASAQPPVLGQYPPTQYPPTQYPQGDPSVTHAATIAVGRRPETTTYNPNQNPSQRASSSHADEGGSLLDNPLAVGAIGAGIALLAGLGAWSAVSFFANRPLPTPSPTPTIDITPSPSLNPSPTTSPTPTASPVTLNQAVDLLPNKPQDIEGGIKANQTLRYRIAAKQGQRLKASLNGQRVLMTVLNPDQQPVEDSAKDTRSWQGEISKDGNYFVQIALLPDTNSSTFKLSLNLTGETIASPSPSPSPSPVEPSPTQPPDLEIQRINIVVGGEVATISDQADPTVIKRYLVTGQQGQVLNVVMTDGLATLNIYYPDGRPVEDASGLLSWQAQLTDSGDYQIDVVTTAQTNFTLQVGLK